MMNWTIRQGSNGVSVLLDGEVMLIIPQSQAVALGKALIQSSSYLTTFSIWGTVEDGPKTLITGDKAPEGANYRFLLFEAASLKDAWHVHDLIKYGWDAPEAKEHENLSRDDRHYLSEVNRDNAIHALREVANALEAGKNGFPALIGKQSIPLMPLFRHNKIESIGVCLGYSEDKEI